ncbi:unnamed protein product, partial [Amoebophrya sp. A120]|eukprot:GSA120T00008109001.1
MLRATATGRDSRPSNGVMLLCLGRRLIHARLFFIHCVCVAVLSFSGLTNRSSLAIGRKLHHQQKTIAPPASLSSAQQATTIDHSKPKLCAAGLYVVSDHEFDTWYHGTSTPEPKTSSSWSSHPLLDDPHDLQPRRPAGRSAGGAGATSASIIPRPQQSSLLPLPNNAAGNYGAVGHEDGRGNRNVNANDSRSSSLAPTPPTSSLREKIENWKFPTDEEDAQ